ncbi:hypothetical protein GCM10009665_76550 [Kitasatospora nipponensis]|uniref:ABC3 transporter permease C-terminal domain-containing protein n=1 Tax=Kitasatospora nipponensis TaxID=258049 RepID=A0ABN1T860_9ACTN
MRPAAWRVALRIARRDALRAKGRSALVLAMIALPVLGVTGVDVVQRSATLSPAEKATRQMGTADVLVEVSGRGQLILQEPFASDGENSQPAPAAGPTAEQRRSQATDPAALVVQLLPAGSRLTPIAGGGGVLASSKDGLLRSQTDEADLSDPVWRGKVNLVGGRAPATDREIAVSQAFLDQSGLAVGGTTTLQGNGDKAFTITGVAEYPNDLKSTVLVARPGALGGASRDASSWLVRLPAGAKVDWPAVLELNKHGFSATSRSVVLHPPAHAQIPYEVAQDGEPQTGYFDSSVVVALVTVVGMALLEIVLLAGPAFAVGARRSRRQLGLLAAGGGDRSHVRAVVLSGGVVLGVAGAVIGATLAIVLVAVTRPWTEPLAGRRFGALTVAPLDVLGIVGVGLVTGLLAALVPAVQASRQEVVAALTGRGGVKPPSKRLTLLGVLMVAGGSALALMGAGGGYGSRSTAVLGGSMIAELGMVACTPMLVGLFGRLGRWLPLGPRLALRDSVRHRGRTAPAVAAVMAAVAGSVAVGIYSASSDEQARQHYVASAPRGAVTLIAGYGSASDGAKLDTQRTAVEQAMPGLGQRADVLRVGYGACKKDGNCGWVAVEPPPQLRCPMDDLDPQQLDSATRSRLYNDPRCNSSVRLGGRFGSVVAGDPTVLHNLFALHDPGVEAAAAAGKVVVFDAGLIENGKTILRLSEPYEDSGPNQGTTMGEPPHHDVAVDAVLVQLDHPAAAAYLTANTAAGLGMTVTDGGSAWLPPSVPSSGAEQRANGVISKLTGSTWNLQVERGFQPTKTLIGLGLTAFAALVALGAAGIATGLAAADSQQDLTTLAAVGAAPRIRRTLSGFQCGVIAAMGSVLGTICGIVPAVALRRVEASGLPGMPGSGSAVIAFPWPSIAATLVGLPLLAVLLAAALTRSRITLLRRAG